MDKNNLESSINRRQISGYIHSRILRTTFAIAILLQVLGLSEPLSAFAVSYFPTPLYHRQEKLETPIKIGETVYLFHSGTQDVKKGIHPNDVLTVHRINTSCQAREAGKIKVIAYVGETYIKGDVVEGEVREDDIAKKGDVACLVVFAGLCDHEQ